MIQGFYTAGSGLMAQQTHLDTIAHNLANLNTTGYKGLSPRFGELLYTTLEKPGGGDQNVNLQNGTGVRVNAMARSFQQGPLEETHRSLDIAIEGDGFFTVLDRYNDEVQYTRDGSFQLSVEEDGVFLVTSRGDYVLDMDGNPIVLEERADFTVDSSGAIFVDDEDTGLSLGLVRFENPHGLEALGENRYRWTEACGAIMPTDTGSVKQGFLERSNVDLIREMTRMIQAQRNYQLSARALRTADEMEAMANNLRA
ncbi:MAG: flagellar basal-body rod protein FlgF [Clostridia bacterium]|jgi:flagellar basal-body rod protein FlgG